MKEIRGVEAIRYTDEHGIDFNVDEDFLIRAEGALLGRPAQYEDLDDLFERELGQPFDPGDLLPDNRAFDFLVNRHGDGWIYVAVEGTHPEEEEAVVLRLCRRRLKEERPASGGDIMDLFLRYRPRLTDTGFPADAGLNLVFHAALRLVARGELIEVPDAPGGKLMSYGKRRFFAPADIEIPLASVMCERCLAERSSVAISLHGECAKRLRKALTGALANR